MVRPLLSLAPYEALRKVKLIMRQAGKQAQRNLSDGPPETAAQKMQLILQLARGIATQYAIITEKVLVKLPLLQRAVQVVNCAQVVVSDQQALDNFSMEVANEALELEKRQIRVNALALGAVQTEMLAKAFPGYNAPLQSEEMAEFVKEFATSGHHFFNGKILPVSLSTP